MTDDKRHGLRREADELDRLAQQESVEPAAPDCYCGRDCEFPCWQRYGIAPVCKSCGCDG